VTGLVVGIDASRNRSGGAKVHLQGLLTSADPRRFGVERVHLWSYDGLLRSIPDFEWLVKHSPDALARPLVSQAWWQFRHLPAEARAAGCDVMLNTDAGSVCYFQPSVVMSRDMLSYEPGEMSRYRFTKAWVRLFLLRYVQAHSLRRATGAVFLTNHAAKTIQQVTGPLQHIAIIPHGVADTFKAVREHRRQKPVDGSPFRAVYVSNTDLYKHQWHVVRAIAQLRERGHNVSLTLIGGGHGSAQARLDREIASVDPHRAFVSLLGAVPNAELPSHLADADLFVFASSCENMPNTLLEGMAAGLPIACSNRGPMPEVLADGGVFFDPEDSRSIAEAIERLLLDSGLRSAVAMRAAALADRYSWARCAGETWEFMSRVVALARSDRASIRPQ
jgi:glycosyltransferase involved in cell wall biosynthesis